MTLKEFCSLFTFYHKKGVPGLYSPEIVLVVLFLKGYPIKISKSWRSNCVWTPDLMLRSTKRKFGALVTLVRVRALPGLRGSVFFTELSEGDNAGNAYFSRERWISLGWYPPQAPISVNDLAADASSSPSAAPSESRLLSEVSRSPSSFSSLGDSSATLMGSPSPVSHVLVTLSEASHLVPMHDHAFLVYRSASSPSLASRGRQTVWLPEIKETNGDCRLPQARLTTLVIVFALVLRVPSYVSGALR